jgi:hypothetical protein
MQAKRQTPVRSLLRRRSLILLLGPILRDLLAPTLWRIKTPYIMLPGTKSMKRRPLRPAHLVFIDECGFMSEHVLRRTWAPRGHTPVIKIADPHGRISAAGALTISPARSKFGFYFQLLPDNENFRGNSIAAFVNSVRFRIGGPLIIIWDQIPIHKSYPVERYVSQHDDILVESFLS